MYNYGANNNKSKKMGKLTGRSPSQRDSPRRKAKGRLRNINFHPAKKITRVKDIFGLLKGKLKRGTQEILDEVNKDFYPQDYE